ncbi:MAG: hypothetical protein D6772_10815 [Bacteroidetes bacterium]|nr:MAG: hypothetical protein D6772_10815 [Bacteroidota bacterium]
MSHLLRTRDFQRTAAKLGMRYSFQDEEGVLPLVRDFRLFRRGWRGKIHHVLTAQAPLNEWRTHIFDYRYLRWGDKRNKRVEQTVFFLESKELELPDFYLEPEHFFHKIGEALRLIKDIDFEQYTNFSYRYRLTGPDEHYIRQRFGHRMLRYFNVEHGWTLEGIGYFMLLYKHGKVLSAAKIEELYRAGTQIYEAILKDQ